MKIDFPTVLVTDICCATLVRTDNWSKGWVLTSRNRPHPLSRQQGGGEVKISADIIGDVMVGICKVPDSIKVTSKTCYLCSRSIASSHWLFGKAVFSCQTQGETDILPQLTSPVSMSSQLTQPGLGPHIQSCKTFLFTK